MYKQIIIVRKDLDMSSGKMAAQVSHASMAFLTNMIRRKAQRAWDANSVQQWASTLFSNERSEKAGGEPPILGYSADLFIPKGLFEEWINGSFVKCILEAKNKNELMKAKRIAEEIGMVEGVDFFLIRDLCLTELTPEDEDGRTLTCIGFKPMDESIIDKIGKKFQLYKD